MSQESHEPINIPVDTTPIWDGEAEIILIHPLSKYAICIKEDVDKETLNRMIEDVVEWWDDNNQPFMFFSPNTILIKMGEMDIVEVAHGEEA